MQWRPLNLHRLQAGTSCEGNDCQRCGDKEFLSFYTHAKDDNVPNGAGDGHFCQFPIEPARLHTPARHAYFEFCDRSACFVCSWRNLP